MPNHVAHRVNVSGPAERVSAFKALMIAEKEDLYSEFHQDPELRGKPNGEIYLDFDFGAIIPMPKCLDGIVSGSDTTFGLFALGGDEERGFGGGILTYPWVVEKGITTREEFRAWLEKDRPEALEMGRRALAAQKECGHQTWYSWSIANWGTKWGAYNFVIDQDEPGHLRFHFDTAWSHPTPVFEKLAELFPDLAIEVLCFDEGWGFAGQGLYGDIGAGPGLEAA